MAEKLFYSMGEVAEMFDVNVSLIRYWTTKFSVLNPKRNKKGNRMFRPEDIENFKLIYHLVKERGMTLEGAQRAMRNRGKSEMSRSAEVMERLQSVRAMLLEMREMLGEEEQNEIVVDDEPQQPQSGTVTVIEPGRAQQLEEAAPATTDERNADLPFYEQTLF